MSADDARTVPATSTDEPMSSAYKLRAQMLAQGRSDQTVAKTDNMVVRLKVYASGGENGLHAHMDEDHTFLVMQGSARFYDKDNNTTDVPKLGGIMIPAGAYYWFEATSKEPLVLYRVGCKLPNSTGKPRARINIKGGAMPGDSTENKRVEVIAKDGEWFE
jgi:mannose-6-phosphate isomerase-like protein (cupin superfamily)